MKLTNVAIQKTTDTSPKKGDPKVGRQADYK